MEIQRIDDTQGEAPGAIPRRFVGEARIQLFASPSAEGPAMVAVHFGPGARTRPHTHRSGQILHVTSGLGVMGTTSGRRLVEAGDVIVVMPGEWHWHGARPGSAMTHVVVQHSAADPVDWDVDEFDWASDDG